jgi:hypothetical protein
MENYERNNRKSRFHTYAADNASIGSHARAIERGIAWMLCRGPQGQLERCNGQGANLVRLHEATAFSVLLEMPD